jgi:hypothetical protein
LLPKGEKYNDFKVLGFFEIREFQVTSGTDALPDSFLEPDDEGVVRGTAGGEHLIDIFFVGEVLPFCGGMQDSRDSP